MKYKYLSYRAENMGQQFLHLPHFKIFQYPRIKVIVFPVQLLCFMYGKLGISVLHSDLILLENNLAPKFHSLY